MWGVMLRAAPARRTRRLIRSQSVTAANGVPRRVMKTFAGVRGVTVDDPDVVPALGGADDATVLSDHDMVLLTLRF